MAGRPPKISDETIRDLHADGLTDTEIAQVVGSGYVYVSRRRRALGIAPNGRRKYDYDEIVDLYLSGMSTRKVAEAVGCNEYTVRRALRELRVKSRDGARLSEADIAKIAECYEDGWPVNEVSKTFGWAPQTVRHYYGGKSPVSLSEYGSIINAMRKFEESTGTSW